ncbi:MAG: hypothetical protein WC856_23190 [Methylococcaceae bacterium]
MIESAVTKIKGIREVVEEWERNTVRRNLFTTFAGSYNWLVVIK